MAVIQPAGSFRRSQLHFVVDEESPSIATKSGLQNLIALKSPGRSLNMKCSTLRDKSLIPLPLVLEESRRAVDKRTKDISKNRFHLLNGGKDVDSAGKSRVNLSVSAHRQPVCCTRREMIDAAGREEP